MTTNVGLKSPFEKFFKSGKSVEKSRTLLILCKSQGKVLKLNVTFWPQTTKATKISPWKVAFMQVIKLNSPLFSIFRLKILEYREKFVFGY